MTPSPTFAQAERPRRIIPAVPRIFEKKLGEEKVQQDERSTVSKAVIPETNVDLSLGNSVSQTPQHIEISAHEREKDDIEKKEIEPSSDQKSLVAESFSGEATSQNTTSLTRTLAFEKHGSDLPRPSSPRSSLQEEISTESHPTRECGVALRQSAETTTEDNDSSKGYHTVNSNGPALPSHLRVAPSFQPYPISSTNGLTSPTSAYRGCNPSQSVSFHGQQTPSTDSLPSPTHSVARSSGHLQDQSFQAHTCLSPNRTSSPTHSVYQGYAYGPLQPPQNFFQSQTIRQPFPGRLQDPGQHYWGQQLPFNALGSQPPLTPSATPFDLTPRKWSFHYGSHPSVSSVYDDRPVAVTAVVGPEHHQPTQSTLISEASCVNNTKAGIAETNQALDSKISPNSHHKTTIPEGQLGNGSSDQLPILEHLLQNFNVDDYADCRLLVVHETDRFKPFNLSLHRLLVARSPTLRCLLRKHGDSRENDMMAQVSLRLTDRFVTPTAIEAAVRTCYGVPVSSFTGTNTAAVPPKPRSKAKFSISWMQESLAFAASGHLLQLEEVVLRGLEIASKILNWENLETALCFALESGRHREYNAEATVIPANGPISPRSSDTSPCAKLVFTLRSDEDPTSGLVTEDGSGEQETLSDESFRPPIRCAYDLLLWCLRFMALKIPESWKVDISARPLADVHRLPDTIESRSPPPDSRLSKIQFGEHPSESSSSRSREQSILASSVVLSLPFSNLKHLLSIGCEPVSSQLHEIVAERERRRKIVIQSESVDWRLRRAAEPLDWAEVGYEESVVIEKDGRNDISRIFTGIYRTEADRINAEQH